MKTALKGGIAFSYLEVELEPGETITTEADAMSSMDAEIELRARLNGGLVAGVLRKYLGNESLFINQFSNPTDQPKRLTLAQGTPGQIREIQLSNESLYLQPGAFVACTPGVSLGLRFAGLVSWIAREGLFRLVVSGTGTVWVGAFGALLDREVDGELIVDTGHLVAYQPGIKLKLQLASGVLSSIFGGEGLVTRVNGKGNIIIQSRSIGGLAGWINPRL